MLVNAMLAMAREHVNISVNLERFVVVEYALWRK
jgi:hypothetical protein